MFLWRTWRSRLALEWVAKAHPCNHKVCTNAHLPVDVAVLVSYRLEQHHDPDRNLEKHLWRSSREPEAWSQKSWALDQEHDALARGHVSFQAGPAKEKECKDLDQHEIHCSCTIYAYLACYVIQEPEKARHTSSEAWLSELYCRSNAIIAGPASSASEDELSDSSCGSPDSLCMTRAGWTWELSDKKVYHRLC